MKGGSCGTTSRRNLRLYYETCIPALLLVLLVCRYGVPSSSNSNSTVLCVAFCLLSLVSLVHRLVLDSSSTETGGARATGEYRLGADDGATYGILLVPLTVLAACVGAPTSPDSGVFYLHPSLFLSLGMSMTFALHYYWQRITHSTRSQSSKSAFTYLLGTVWLVANVVLSFVSSKHLFGGKLILGVVSFLLSFASALQISLRKELVRALPRSFTLGELTVLTQAYVLIAMDSIFSYVHREPRTGSSLAMTREDWKSYMNVRVLEAVLISLYISVVVLERILRSGKLGERARRGVPGLLLLSAVFGGLVLGHLSLLANTHEINGARWMLNTALGSRAHLAMLAYWAALLAVAGTVYVLVVAKYDGSSKLVLHVKRKSYHLLAVLMFVPGLVFTRPLLHLAFVVALAGFVMVECMRALDIGPCSKAIDVFMRRFVDYRDAGPVITAHFYLLLGCAVP
ncbi:hypothetical protein GGI21_001862, partial [Coemansia aciculifera]